MNLDQQCADVREFEYRHEVSGEFFRVRVSLDFAEIARTVAARAYQNKNGKATHMDGLIQCEVIARGVNK